jgi:hypothetical protein
MYRNPLVSSSAKRIFDALSGDYLDSAEICKLTGLGRLTVDFSLKVLEAQGQIEWIPGHRDKHGKWIRSLYRKRAAP